VRDPGPGNPGARRFGRRVADNGNGSGGNRFVDEAISVGAFPAHGDESEAGFHAPRVVVETTDLRVSLPGKNLGAI
jgi:hypothetical protein